MKDKEKQTYDVLRLRFIKAQDYSEYMKNFRGGKKSNNAFTLLCMGHFDFIEVAPLVQEFDDVAPLQMIEKDQMQKGTETDRDSIVYPHYVLKLRETNASLFWEKQALFTSFVRIHCKKQKMNQLLSEFMKQQLEQENLNNPIIHKQGQSVSYQIYDSLELGDVVAVLRSQSIRAILFVIMGIRKLPFVRSTYSYHGVDASSFENSDCLSDEIVFATTRFSLNDNTVEEIQNINIEIKSLLSSVNTNSNSNLQSLFYITGATDYLLNWGAISEKVLFGTVFNQMSREGSALQKVLHEAITRIGCSINELPLQGKLPTTNNPQESDQDTIREEREKVKRLLNELIKEFNKDTKKDVYSQTWLVSFLRLMDSLETMSKSPYTDELSLLMRPSVKALLVQIVSHLKEDDYWNPAVDVKINSFISSCVSLSNDIATIDSHLHQRPELAPAYYYVPATLLRFAQHFTTRCCKALNNKGKEDGPKYIPMVKTSQQNNVSTECPIADVEKDINLECPIQINLPVNALFQPWRAAIQLGHEAAHYSGIAFRNREGRCDFLSECVANYICRKWLEKTYIEKPASKSVKIFEEFVKHYKQRLFKKAEIDCHLKKVTESLFNGAWQIYSSPSEFEQFFDIIISKNAAQSNKQYFFDFDDSLIIQDHICQVLHYYCRECYADIAVCVLLDCTFSDYYNGVYQQEFTWIDETVEESAIEMVMKDWRIEKHLIRMAFVIDAMVSLKKWNKEKIKEFVSDMRENENTKYQYFKNVVMLIEMENKDWEIGYDPVNACKLYFEEVRSLKEYFRCCANTVNEGINNQSDEVIGLRKALTAISDKSFDLSYIQQFVYGET